MTARKPTDAGSDNSGVNDDRIDRNELLEIVRQRGGATIEGLAKRTGLTQSEVRWMVIALQEAGLIDVQTGLHAVRVEATPKAQEDDSVATDGGVIRSLMNAVGGEQPSIDLTEAQLFDIIRNERRRRLIRLFAGLYDGDELTFVKVGKLAETLARAEKNGDGPLTAQDRRRQYISLIQTHLPMLDEHGVVEYFDRAKKVRVDEDAVLIADVVDSIGDLCDGTEEQTASLSEIDAEEAISGDH